MNRMLIAALAIVIAIASERSMPVSAASCEGNACSAVSVTWNGACYSVANNDGSRTARVSLHTGWAGFARSLKPGEIWVPALGAYCVKSYIGPYKASFE